jgi:hypothetical protein
MSDLFVTLVKKMLIPTLVSGLRFFLTSQASISNILEQTLTLWTDSSML